MVRTFGLTHIQLTVTDLERAIAFYTQVFGMQQLRRLGSSAVMLRTPDSREVFTLNQSADRAARAGDMGGIAHFGFRLHDAEDLDAAVADVERAGGKLIARGERKGDEVYAFVHDPDGYELEIFYAPPGH